MPGALFPAVVVNGVTIPRAEIAREAQNHPVSDFKPGEAWKAAARALALRELLRQEVVRRGISADPRDLGAGRWESDEEASIRSLLESALSVDPPSPADVRAAYDGAPERYRSPRLFEVSHILFAVADADSGARARARKRADATLAILKTDSSAFAELARTHSDCASAREGGRLGQMAEGDALPEFEDALVRLAPGEIGPEPIETAFGLHVVRLDARAEGALLPFDSVKGQIAEAMERATWVREARVYVARLLESSEIEGIAFEKA